MKKVFILLVLMISCKAARQSTIIPEDYKKLEGGCAKLSFFETYLSTIKQQLTHPVMFKELLIDIEKETNTKATVIKEMEAIYYTSNSDIRKDLKRWKTTCGGK